MITAEEAYDLTDPDLPDEARTQAAQNIMAGVAANDAYLNSRSELERIIALAKGGQVPPAHSDLNSEGAADAAVAQGAKVEPLPGTAASTTSTATEIGPAKAGDPVPTAADERAAEIDALNARLAELEGGKQHG